jgi:hypothetical protein
MDTDLLALLLSASFLEDIQIRAILYQACAEGRHDTSAVHVMSMAQIYSHASMAKPLPHLPFTRSISVFDCVAGPCLSISVLGIPTVVVHLEGITQLTACCSSSLVALLRSMYRADAVRAAVPALLQHHAP